MKRAIGGFYGESHLTYTHRAKDNSDDSNRLSLSNSSSEDLEDVNNENDSTMKPKNSAMLTASADIEAAIRSFCALNTRKKKTKAKPTINSQKADLPQLNMIVDKTNNLNEQSHHWFPKPNIGNVDSKDFIRHNHVGKSTKSVPKKQTYNLHRFQILNKLMNNQCHQLY